MLFYKRSYIIHKIQNAATFEQKLILTFCLGFFEPNHPLPLPGPLHKLFTIFLKDFFTDLTYVGTNFLHKVWHWMHIVMIICKITRLQKNFRDDSIWGWIKSRDNTQPTTNCQFLCIQCKNLKSNQYLGNTVWKCHHFSSSSSSLSLQ